MTDGQREAMYTAVTFAARRVMRRHHRYVDIDDLKQHGFEWMLQHSKQCEDFFREADGERAMVIAVRRFGRKVEREMDKLARAERAAKLGYRPEDEFFYGRQLVEQVLPAIWHSDLAAIPEVRERDEVRGKSDPAETGNWLAFVLDIKRAWERAEITLAEEAALRYVYGMGLSQEMAAHLMSLGRHAFRNIVDGAMRRLVTELNGATPESDELEAELESV